VTVTLRALELSDAPASGTRRARSSSPPWSRWGSSDDALSPTA